MGAQPSQNWQKDYFLISSSGQLKQLQHKRTQLRIDVVSLKAESLPKQSHHSIIDHLTRKRAKNSTSLIPIEKVQIVHEKSTCGVKTRYDVVFKECEPSLQHIAQQRNKRSIAFDEGEIKRVIAHVALGLKDLRELGQGHCSINLRNICMNEDKVKLKDPLTIISKDSSPNRLEGYPSPQKLYTKLENQSQSDQFLSDLFSLGMVALQLYYPNTSIHKLYHQSKPFLNYVLNVNQLRELVIGVEQSELRKGIAILLSERPKDRLRIYELLLDQKAFKQIGYRKQPVQQLDGGIDSPNRETLQEQIYDEGSIGSLGSVASVPAIPVQNQGKGPQVSHPNSKKSKMPNLFANNINTKPPITHIQPMIQVQQIPRSNQDTSGLNGRPRVVVSPPRPRTSFSYQPPVKVSFAHPPPEVFSVLSVPLAPVVLPVMQQVTQVHAIKTKPVLDYYHPIIHKVQPKLEIRMSDKHSSTVYKEQSQKTKTIRKTKQPKFHMCEQISFQYKPEDQSPLSEVEGRTHSKAKRQTLSFEKKDSLPKKEEPLGRVLQMHEFRESLAVSQELSDSEPDNIPLPIANKQASGLARITEVNEEGECSHSNLEQINVEANSPESNQESVINSLLKSKYLSVSKPKDNQRELSASPVNKSDSLEERSKTVLSEEKCYPLVEESPRMLKEEESNFQSPTVSEALLNIKMSSRNETGSQPSEQEKAEAPQPGAVDKDLTQTLRSYVPYTLSNQEDGRYQRQIPNTKQQSLFDFQPCSAGLDKHRPSLDRKSSSDTKSLYSRRKLFVGRSAEEDVVHEEEQGRYEGHMLLGKKHGRGTLEFATGYVYKGQWVNDMMQGHGSLFYPSGKLAYEGEWHHGQFDGYGLTFNSDPNTLKTYFDFTNFNKLSDEWVSYEGGFDLDAMHGTGKWVLSNGETYEGSFVHGQVHGEGKFTALDGDVMHGLWDENIMVKLLSSPKFERKREESRQGSASSRKDLGQGLTIGHQRILECHSEGRGEKSFDLATIKSG